MAVSHISSASISRTPGLFLLLLLSGTAFIETLRADPFENFANFGKQVNFVCPVSNGVCAAASTINSFIFLENQYPSIYGNMLTPGIQGTKPNQTDPADTLNFANFYYGYLPTQGGNAFSNYRYAEMAWFSAFAFGTTTITSMYQGSPDNDGLPTVAFLQSEIESQEDVELFVYDSTNTIAHAIALTGIMCTPPAGPCVIKYQDPNSPTQQQTSQLLNGPGGVLQIQGLPGTGAPYLTTIFSIDAAFSESPTPEPASSILVASATFLCVLVKRSRASFHRARGFPARSV